MEEVLTRRLTAYLAERDRPVGRARRASSRYPPQLLLVDGGKGQLARGRAGARGARARPTRSRSPSLAKRFEEVYVPGRGRPGPTCPRQSEALYLLQRIRDEAHRFAITFHRELRGKRMTTQRRSTASPGSATTRKKRLVKELGGVNAVKRATLEELQALQWLPDAVAEAVYDKFHPAHVTLADVGPLATGRRRCVATSASKRSSSARRRSRSRRG